MSRYLRRVVSRTRGPALGSLQASRPLRWTGLAAEPAPAAAGPVSAAGDHASSRKPVPSARGVDDPFADAERPAVPSRRPASEYTRPVAPGSVLAADAASGSITVEPRARTARDAAHPTSSLAPLPARPAARLAARSEHTRLQSTEALAAPHAQLTAGAIEHASPATNPLHIAVASTPGTPPALAGSAPRHDEPSAVAMPLPVTTRRELAPPPAAAPGAVASATGDAPAASPVIAVPVPSRHAAAPSPAERPEIVIGRISVIVEGGRAPAAAPRTIVRHVTTSPRAADDTAPAPRFGRFGLGQL